MKTLVLTLLLGAALFGPVAAKGDDRLATIHVPEGFVIEAFAAVPNARQMAWGEKATLFVGTRREGRVFAVTDEDGGGRQHHLPLRRHRVPAGRPARSRGRHRPAAV